MSRSEQEHGSVALGFPRVSGDEPVSVNTVATGFRFSPRERG